MKFRSIQILTVLSVAAGAARVVAAAEPSSPWSLSISGGDSISESGSLRTPATTTFTDLGALDPALSGTSGTLRLDKLRYEDLFRRSFDTGLELDYSFNPNLQSYGRFGYASLDGRTRTIGALDNALLDTPAAVRAHFANADNMTFEFGSRYFWTTGTDWRPFAGFALGSTHLDSMHATVTSTALASDLTNLRFTRTATIFSQSLETGVEYTPSSAFGVRLSVDADHVGKPPNADDARLTGLGFGPNDDAHSLWSFPVSIAANYRF
ncbi:MAG: hypothetical protein WDO68_24290 [Gammaproteobacteria bacterium]